MSAAVERAEARPPRPLPWRTLLGLAALGALVATALVLGNLATTEDQLGTLVDAAPDSGFAEMLRDDLGPSAVRPGGEHDGQHFYALARDPFDLDAFAEGTDRPAYRAGRIGFPLLAWALHPTGGGPVLMWTMFAIGVAGLVLGGVAAGGLAVGYGGRPWPAAVFPLLLGSMIGLRITVPDALALAFALSAVLALQRQHLRWSLVLAVAAVLTKESLLLVLAGVALDRRDRRGAALVLVPGLVAAAWQVVLRIRLGDAGGLSEVVPPFTGLADAVSLWWRGVEPLAPFWVVLSLGLAAAALARAGWRHPLVPAIALQLAFVVVASVSVIGLERNASRALLPLNVLSLIVLASPGARRRRGRAAAVPPGDLQPSA